MNASQEKALFHLTGQSDLSKIQESTLKQMAAEFPYFAPIHLFLAEKCHATDPAQYEAASQKANLYFTNPYWLHYQLNSRTLSSALQDTGISLAASPEIPVTQAPNSNSISNDDSIPTIEKVKEMMRGIDKQPLIVSTERLREDSVEMAPELPVILVSPDPTIVVDREDPENEASTPADAYDEKEATAISHAKISSLLSDQLANFKKPVTEADQLGLPKDPMHTIDYFASQGIKIDLSQIPQDKLTTHLRRFTDWIKYMKSETPNPIDFGTRKDLEAAVELNAQISNESKEVLTESMADVLQKQGQIDKAIQLYIKLSFLNPEKSAYFAAKIQHLKGIQ